MSVLATSLAKSGCRRWWSLSLLFYATLVTSESPNGDSSPTQNQCLSGSGHGQRSVRVPLTQNCLNNVFLHIKSMVTVVIDLVTTLTGSKGRINPAAARNAVHSWRMSTVSPRTTFRVTSDPRHNKVYLPVLCALHEWPLTQMSFIAGAIRPLSAVPCCKWRVTLDTDVMSSHCRCYATTCSWNVKVFYRGDAVDIPLIWKLCSREWHKHQYWVSLSCRAAPVGFQSWANNFLWK